MILEPDPTLLMDGNNVIEPLSDDSQHTVGMLITLRTFHTFLSSADFFKIDFFEKFFQEKFFQEYHLSVKQIGSRSGQTLCWT